MTASKTHKPQHNNWSTPKDFYDKLNEEFKFDFDPCPLNHDMSWNGLEVEWGSSNFVNPPYDLFTKEAFIRKGLEEHKKGKKVVMLLPVSTSTKIFHDIILPNCDIRFVRRRLKFSEKKTSGTFDSMVVIFKN